MYFNNQGFEILSSYFGQVDIEKIISTLNKKGVFAYQFEDAESHNLLNSIREVREFAKSEKLLELVRSVVGFPAEPLHAIILDKTVENNWELDWHQDLKIAVTRKVQQEGYDNWSIEAGIWHVVPPVHILEKMLILRVHLDDCGSRSGSLWIVPGSHKQGIIKSKDIGTIVKSGKIYDCEVKRSDLMLMSPLVLHKSPYSLSSTQRRVLQIEYHATKLDGRLKWYY